MAGQKGSKDKQEEAAASKECAQNKLQNAKCEEREEEGDGQKHVAH